MIASPVVSSHGLARASARNARTQPMRRTNETSTRREGRYAGGHCEREEVRPQRPSVRRRQLPERRSSTWLRPRPGWPGRAGQLPADPAAGRREAGGAIPAPGHRVQQDDPARDPQRRHLAGPALPLARRLQPAREGLRSPPRQAHSSRWSHRPHRLRPALQLPPSDWGWTLVLNKDGTTTAWNPARTKILHSHSPPRFTGPAPGGTRPSAAPH